MTREEAAAIVRAKWEEADGCGSCGWKSALYEHEPIHVDQSDIDKGYVRFACLSDDASENGGHRGIRIDLSTPHSAQEAQ